MLKSLLSKKTWTHTSAIDSVTPSPAEDPLDRLARVRKQLKSVPEEEEDTGQFEVSKAGLKTSGVPRWAMGMFAAVVGLAILVAALGWAYSKSK